jgi:hypothetical protein
VRVAGLHTDGAARRAEIPADSSGGAAREEQLGLPV